MGAGGEPLRPGEVAKMFGVRSRTVQRWVEEGKFEEYGVYPWKTPGGEARFDEGEVRAAIDVQRARNRVDLRKVLQSMSHLDKVYVLAVANMKGGVGKTTIAVNLAVALAKRYSWRVLVVDVDPQGNTTSHLHFSKLEGKVKGGFIPFEGQVADIWKFRGGKSLKEIVVQTGFPTGDEGGEVDLVPTDFSALEIEHAITAVFLDWARMGKLPTPQQFQEVIQDFYMTLSYRLDELMALVPYDIVIIDTPPTLGPLTTSALLACDGFLVPVEPEEFSKNGVEEFRGLVDELCEKLDHRVDPLGYVINVSRRTTTRRNATQGEIKDSLAGVFEKVIHEDSNFSNAQAEGVPIYEYVDASGRNVGRTSRGAEEIWELAAEVKERIEQHSAMRKAEGS